MQITEKEKNIYNCFLKHYRNGEPFQSRKNFNDLTPYFLVNLKKVGMLFQKYPHIKWDEFFGAPRKLNSDEKCPNLDFFTTRAAIKSYNLYKKQQENQNPENLFDEIKQSFHFIGMFCLKNKLKLNQYINHQTGIIPTWIEHYQKHHINLYSIIELGDPSSQLNRLSQDEKELYGNDIYKSISNIKMKYHNSEKTKKYIKTIIEKIENFLKSNLQS